MRKYCDPAMFVCPSVCLCECVSVSVHVCVCLCQSVCVCATFRLTHQLGCLGGAGCSSGKGRRGRRHTSAAGGAAWHPGVVAPPSCQAAAVSPSGPAPPPERGWSPGGLPPPPLPFLQEHRWAARWARSRRGAFWSQERQRPAAGALTGQVSRKCCPPMYEGTLGRVRQRHLLANGCGMAGRPSCAASGQTPAGRKGNKTCIRPLLQL